MTLPSLRSLRVAATAIVLAIAALGGGEPRSASATEYGMSDNRSALFDAPHLHELAFTRVRLVLPWDAARHTGTWETWLTRAQLQGFPIMVAPTIDKPNRCDLNDRCAGPTPAEYGVSLRELLARYPGIEAVEAWNEPNHSTQPTAGDPALAARYFDAAAAACAGRCTAVAGNLLDAQSMGGYLRTYQEALGSKPAVWGVHDYYDATYFSRSGLDQTLAVTSGPVWVTEIGGLVSFKPPGSSGGLPADEHRAADSLRWMFTLAGRTPRLERMYLYGMWQQLGNPFDSALLRADNAERESMAVARAYIGPRRVKLSGPEAPELIDPSAVGPPAGIVDASGMPTTPSSHAVLPEPAVIQVDGRLRISGKKLVVRGASRRLTIEVRCVGDRACRGRLEVKAPGWTTRRSVSVPATQARSLVLRAPVRAARRLGAKTTGRAWARVCDGTLCGSARRVGLVRG